MTETPNFLNSTYSSNTYTSGGFDGLAGVSTMAVPYGGFRRYEKAQVLEDVEKYQQAFASTAIESFKKEKEKMADYKYRIVQVFIVDTNPSLPADKAILYRGEQQFTDATDQELFFALDVAGMLKKHNEMRVTLKDKKLSKADGIVYLEPARIRDLTMNIVDVVRF